MPKQPRKAKLAKEVILRSRRRLCNNCTGGPTNLQSCRPQLRRRPRSGGAAAASAFTTISGYDGRMQAGRSPAAKKQRYITSNDRYKSRAFSLSSTCVPVPKIRHYQGNFALLYCSLTAFIPTATGRQCGMVRARRCRPAAAKAALDSCRQDFLEQSTSGDFIATSVQFLV